MLFFEIFSLKKKEFNGLGFAADKNEYFPGNIFPILAFPTGVFCRLGEWKCSDGRQCVGERQRCDGKTGMWKTIFLTLSGINALNFVFSKGNSKKMHFFTVPRPTQPSDCFLTWVQ